MNLQINVLKFGHCFLGAESVASLGPSWGL